MSPVAFVRLVLAVVSVGFGFSAFALSEIIERTQKAVDNITRHESAWAAANGRYEVANLRAAAAEFFATGDYAAQGRLDLTIRILEGRLNLLKEGAFQTFVTSTPVRQERFTRLEGLVKDLSESVSQLPAPAAWTTFRDQIEATSVLMTRVATDAQAAGLEDAKALGEQLSQKQLLQNIVLGGLALSVGLLVVVSEMQNRMLSRARNAAVIARKQSEHLARHDVLTSLPNRAAFSAAFEASLGRRSVNGERFAVFVLDLDGFKPINDTLGHNLGDAILCSVAERLRSCLAGEHDLVSRFGGDEFVILVHGIGDAVEALGSAHQFRAVLRRPHLLGGHSLMIDASIGGAVSTGTDGDVELLHHADIALNKAKSAGRAQTMLFRPQLLEEVEHRGRIERDLAHALNAGQIVPNYQPQIDIESGEIVGVEALARWTHPVYGAIPPSEFIPVAETSGQISEIGFSILRQACHDAVAHFPPHTTLAVNVSAAQIVQDDFAMAVSDALSSSGLPAHRLVLEITESAMMKDTVRAERTVERLKAQGVRVSLDDFGTGHSSLSYLRRFRLDELKIDRAFVTNIESSSEDAAIILAIIRLARTLKLTVVAEGVETAGQLERLRRLGCSRAQGYLTGRPTTAEALFGHQPERLRALAS